MKKVLLSMMAVAALASCAKEEGNTPAPVDNNEITLVSNTVNAMTKASLSGDFTGIARVLASANQTNFSTLYGSRDATNTYIKFDGTTSAKGFTNAAGDDPQPEYYQGNENVYLCGFYPNTWTIAGAYESIDGKTDVMFAPAITVNKSTEVAYRKLTFNHLLTKLDVQVKIENGEIDNWGTITSMTLSSNTKISVDVASLPTAVSSITPANFSEPSTLNFYSTTGDAQISNTALPEEATTQATDFAYIMCAPVTADGTENAEYTLNIVTEKAGSYTVPLNLKNADNSTDFDKSTLGYQFKVLLTFESTEITATATIAPWNQGGQTEATVGSDTQN